MNKESTEYAHRRTNEPLETGMNQVKSALLLQEDPLIFRLYGELLFTSSNCILVADGSATSVGIFYPSYRGFFRTDVLSSQYRGAEALLDRCIDVRSVK